MFRLLDWANAVKETARLMDACTTTPADDNTQKMTATLQSIRKALSVIYYTTGFENFEGYPITEKLFLDQVDPSDDHTLYEWHILPEEVARIMDMIKEDLTTLKEFSQQTPPPLTITPLIIPFRTSP